jgi:hypothetical protein
MYSSIHYANIHDDSPVQRPRPRVRTNTVNAFDKQAGNTPASETTPSVVASSPDVVQKTVNPATHQRFVLSDPVAFRYGLLLL